MLQRVLLLLWLLLPITPAYTADSGMSAVAPPIAPTITIVIDDLGNRLQADSRAIALPGPVSYAILPHTPYARRMARLAHELGKDVLVHIPMQAEHARHLLGPGALLQSMSRGEFTDSVAHSIAAVPYACGISNHMGSVLTADRHAMRSLMAALQPTGLFFLDSYTSAGSVAAVSAKDYRIPYLRRDVFLDNDRSENEIRRQFRRLLSIARENGYAIAIGHPYPETIAVLNELLPQLNRQDIRLIGICSMLFEQSDSVGAD